MTSYDINMLSPLTSAIAIFPPNAVLFTIQMAIILAAKEDSASNCKCHYIHHGVWLENSSNKRSTFNDIHWSWYVWIASGLTRRWITQQLVCCIVYKRLQYVCRTKLYSIDQRKGKQQNNVLCTWNWKILWKSILKRHKCIPWEVPNSSFISLNWDKLVPSVISSQTKRSGEAGVVLEEPNPVDRSGFFWKMLLLELRWLMDAAVPDEVLYFIFWDYDEHDNPQNPTIREYTPSDWKQRHANTITKQKTKKHEAFTEDSLSLQQQQWQLP